jgi:hypothetical protein
MGSKPLIMKYLCMLFALYLLAGCGNKKAEIVEEIKKVKNELARAKMNQGWYRSAGTHLRQYENASKQTAHIYKEAFEMDKDYLKNADPEVLKSSKKLDSVALIWEGIIRAYTIMVDSLEIELKKY